MSQADEGMGFRDGQRGDPRSRDGLKSRKAGIDRGPAESRPWSNPPRFPVLPSWLEHSGRGGIIPHWVDREIQELGREWGPWPMFLRASTDSPDTPVL